MIGEYPGVTHFYAAELNTITNKTLRHYDDNGTGLLKNA
jgi:hypothetical protein